MASGGPPSGTGPPQTYSLECTSAQCALGENGAKWRTPAYPLEFAMQMLTMHTDTNHKHPQQAQVVNATTQKHKAEKVNRPTIKMGWAVAKMIASSSNACLCLTRGHAS